MTINSAAAGTSGGVIYLTGLNAVLNSNTMTINTASASNGNGGIFSF